MNKENTENTMDNPVTTEPSKTKTEKTPEQKKANKDNWIAIGANFVLAAIPAYLFEPWFDKVVELNFWRMTGNMLIVFLLAVTLFTAATSYKRGTINKVKLVFVLIFMAVVILGIMVLVSPAEKDILYPFSGILIVLIGFYMLYLTTGTMEPEGIWSMAFIFAAIIVWLKVYHDISWDTVAEISQFAVFSILFFGGNWARLRMAWFGVRGINKDGGFGDSNDGSGENED